MARKGAFLQMRGFPRRMPQGETDGSSFPNGGLRVTHSAAAFTTWDRASPPFVLDQCLYIPCAPRMSEVGQCQGGEREPPEKWT